jgi:hypothetical protein
MNENIKRILEKSNLHIDPEQEKSFEQFIQNFLSESIDVMCEKDYHGEWLGEQLFDHFGLLAEGKSAADVEGFLIKTIDGETLFRLYDELGDFCDYTIAHQDLKIKIVDTEAYFYHRGEDHVLDYSPKILGISNDGSTILGKKE